MKIRLCLLTGALLLAGCASTDLVFVTKTSLSFADFDPATSGSGVTMGYSRVEGFAGYKCKGGKAPPVVAIINGADKVLSANVSQLFATGNAALVASGAPKADESPSTPKSDDAERIVFGTGTTLGLKIGYEAGKAVNLVLGHRRREAAFIPLDGEWTENCKPGGVPSVFASYRTGAEASGADAKIRLMQVFGTGGAAEQLADKFKNMLEVAAEQESQKQISSIKAVN
jgi:hypothetical protein